MSGPTELALYDAKGCYYTIDMNVFTSTYAGAT